MTRTHINDAGTYKPGDPPPDGYNQWHEWAKVQKRSGLRQRQCSKCWLWRFPQEMAAGELCKVCEVGDE